MSVLRSAALLFVLTLYGCGESTQRHSSKEETRVAESRQQQAGSGNPLKIAFVYVSPVGDGGWTYTHDTARKLIETEFGARVQTRTIENVPEGPASEKVFHGLAKDGYKLIFGASVGYMGPMLKVAKDYPDVKFENASGSETAPNVANYQARTYEGAYLAGIIAGKMTRTGKLGFVASFPVPEVIRNINAFTLGAQSVNPAVITMVAWVDTWYDLAKERTAAEQLIRQQADVLIQSTNSSAVLKTAQEKGMMAFGWDSDMTQYGPDAHLGSALIDWSAYYKQRVAQVLGNQWQPASTWLGVRERTIRLASPNPHLPVDVTLLLGERTVALRDRTLHPFRGPVVDEAGVERVRPGSVMSDSEIKNFNFFVKGVTGTRHQGKAAI